MQGDLPHYYARRKKFNKIMTWCFCIGPLVFVISAGIMFVSHAYIATVVTSSDLCGNALAIDISSWLLPKIVSHCNMISGLPMQVYYKRDIIIFMDIYIEICWILQIALCMLTWKNLVPEDFINIRHRVQVRREKLMVLTILIEILSILCAIGLGFYVVYFFPDLLPDNGFMVGYLSMFSAEFGLGPMFQTFMGSGSVLVAFSIIIIMRAHLLE